MDCCKFENEMTRYIPSFAGFTEFTASIPKLYWGVKSQEQRILALCRLLNKVICYADMLGENVEEIHNMLQDILDGKLDELIIAAIAQWFDDHEPEIMADIEALQTAVATLNANIGEGFTSENTVADAIADANTAISAEEAARITADTALQTAIDDEAAARAAADTALQTAVDDEAAARAAADTAMQTAIEYNRSFIDEVDVRSFVNPIRKGVIRCATHNYDDSTANDPCVWPQGFCIHNGIMTQVEFNTDGGARSALYQRSEADTTWGEPVYANIKHGHSIIYVPATNNYYVGTADANEVIRLDSALVRAGRYVLGNHAEYGVLLTYDKVTGICYGSHYGDDLFTWNPTASSPAATVEYLEPWNMKISKDGGALQDIAVYNGFLYILYSSTGRIDKWRISDGQYICSYTFANRQGSFFIGECEGLDIDEEGKVWFSAGVKFNDMYAYHYTYILMFDPDNPQNVIADWKTSIAGTTKSVCPATRANILGCQNADGTGTNPYPTICEAIFDIMLQNTQYMTLLVGGEHSDEPISVYLPNLLIQGQSDDKPRVGQISTRAGRLTVDNVIVSPKVSDFAYFINGYRNGILQYNSSNVVFEGTSTSGLHVRSNGTLLNSISNLTE